MRSYHRYIFDKSGKKFNCPECAKRRFVRYIDTETGDYLPEHYGRCDRESKCSFFRNPYSDGFANAVKAENHRINANSVYNSWQQSKKDTKLKPLNKVVHFDFETFKHTLEPENYERNTFIQNLFYGIKYPFDVKTVTEVIQLYRLGTVATGYRPGAVTFPFIDIDNNVRTIQVKQFDERNKTTSTDFLHSIIEKGCVKSNIPLPEWMATYLRQDKKVTCLFGEHLLRKYPLNPVVLVEAPKTAVYGTLYFGTPNTLKTPIWLAVYNKSSFSSDRLKVLQDKEVFVFPDLSEDGSTFREWEKKAKTYANEFPGIKFVFSDLLERLAPESDKCEGADLADYLIRQDWREFRKSTGMKTKHLQFENAASVVSEALGREIFSNDMSLKKHTDSHTEPTQETVLKPTLDWCNEIMELEHFFSRASVLPTTIKLNKCSTITNVKVFIEGHLAAVKANNGKKCFLPYLYRIQELKKLLIQI